MTAQKHFYDWLTITQDFGFVLPLIGDRSEIVINNQTGEQLATKQPIFRHKGSFSTSISISIRGSSITVKGNPSRINRLDNLFGFKTLDECVLVYNSILTSLGLPNFSKCTKIDYLATNKTAVFSQVSDGAIIQELHITTNKTVGIDNEDSYLKGISTQRYKYMIPRLHTNGKTCDWLNAKGKASSLIYPSIYSKSFELRLHSLGKIKRLYGDKSKEYKYIKSIIKYCETHGVVRFEQKLKSPFLRKHGLRFYGILNEDKFINIQKEFVNLDEKLQVTAMTLENISERLIRKNICKDLRASNTTAMYALQWLQGMTFFNQKHKRQVNEHRSRLRKIGIDIFDVCDISRHSPVYVKKAVEIEVGDLSMPGWYKQPVKLSLVA